MFVSDFMMYQMYKEQERDMIKRFEQTRLLNECKEMKELKTKKKTIESLPAKFSKYFLRRKNVRTTTCGHASVASKSTVS
ncbi:MAG: hypothetical protein JW795_15685 [Chitinivibrionales bacterium]|nr:hypothetical protein [Chitinivibrionales bacterium]